MPDDDTIKLLRECNSGIKMGVASIDEVLDHVKCNTLSDLLSDSKRVHEDIGNRTHELLNEYKDEGKEPNVMAKTMSWLKTNTKLIMNESDKEIADLIIDGCNMGVKSLSRYINQYPAASDKVKNLAEELIKEEQRLMDKLRIYL